MSIVDQKLGESCMLRWRAAAAQYRRARMVWQLLRLIHSILFVSLFTRCIPIAKRSCTHADHARTGANEHYLHVELNTNSAARRS
jgi:hypothetical protein